MPDSTVTEPLRRQILAVARQIPAGIEDARFRKFPRAETFDDSLATLGDLLAATYSDKDVVPRQVITWVLWIFGELAQLSEHLEPTDPRRSPPWQFYGRLQDAFGRVTISG